MATQQINPKRQQELQAQYQNYKTTLQQLAQKIGDIEQETEEHKLVIDTLQPLPGDRKCFRMINGVLVERTVKDVIPSLKTNSDGLKQVLDELLKQYKAKQDELDGWKVSIFYGTGRRAAGGRMEMQSIAAAFRFFPVSALHLGVSFSSVALGWQLKLGFRNQFSFLPRLLRWLLTGGFFRVLQKKNNIQVVRE
ncbi:hypothetical protein AJ78_07020 [Emergomyces pasteurianus Ep9510]|uniref:Prefoldin subunit 2 n=1 Tax=Emergomyces pasteurianus Ep9510 TaxID=1447872 RepID=A0A1J9P8F7_9EURO|nr:hypothetical protein AJ78_07020 [Emergomyces pasteurianus Ep9510]